MTAKVNATENDPKLGENMGKTRKDLW